MEILEYFKRDIIRFVSSLSDKKCSHIHILLDVFFDRIFDVFYSFKVLREKFELSCFPIFKLNCIQCGGCSHNRDPLLSPPKSKGPYKVYTTPLFNEQYGEMFGKTALVDLLFDLEKHNASIEERE